MEIILFPHPTLRHKSKPIRRVDSALKEMVREMFTLMYEADGIGLAANQVDLPLQMFVINITGGKDREQELVFINPVVSQPKGKDEADEGCLSIPGVTAQVSRPSQVHVSAYDLSGNAIDFMATGLLAKAIQHENDHLNGVLFIDRVSESEKKQIAGELEEFEFEFDSRRKGDLIPDDRAIKNRLAEIESKYC